MLNSMAGHMLFAICGTPREANSCNQVRAVSGDQPISAIHRSKQAAPPGGSQTELSKVTASPAGAKRTSVLSYVQLALAVVITERFIKTPKDRGVEIDNGQFSHCERSQKLHFLPTRWKICLALPDFGGTYTSGDVS